MTDEQKSIEQKLGELGELYWQLWESGDKPGMTELEASEELVSLSKEVATHYKPLVEKLVAAGILTANVVPRGEVYEVDAVVPEHKSYFNEGKILVYAAEEPVNAGNKLKAKYQKRLGRFMN